MSEQNKASPAALTDARIFEVAAQHGWMRKGDHGQWLVCHTNAAENLPLLVRALLAAALQAGGQPVAFNERASVWKVQNPETGYVWFTESREQALQEARFGKTVTGLGSALVAPAPVAAPAALSDGAIREIVNQLRDIAVEFHATQQLRARIAHVIVPRLKSVAAAPAVLTVPDGYAIKRVEGHGWIIDPPSGSRWIAHEGTPAGDFMATLLAAQPAAPARDGRQEIESAYQRDFEKVCRAVKFNAETFPELENMSPTGAIGWLVVELAARHEKFADRQGVALSDDAIILAWVNKMGLGGLNEDQLATMESFCAFARTRLAAQPAVEAPLSARVVSAFSGLVADLDRAGITVSADVRAVLADAIASPAEPAHPDRRVVLDSLQCATTLRQDAALSESEIRAIVDAAMAESNYSKQCLGDVVGDRVQAAILSRASSSQGVALSDADTGWEEADAIIGRLMSDDPDFDDCQDAATFIRRIYDEHLRGPDGYATWKEAAIAERVMRVKNVCQHGIHMDNACGACIPPRGTTIRPKAASVSRASSSRAEVEIPVGWKLIAVSPAFDDLIYALDRAESKGYMPDAMLQEWNDFAFKPLAAAEAKENAAARAEGYAKGLECAAAIAQQRADRLMEGKRVPMVDRHTADVLRNCADAIRAEIKGE